VLTPAQITEPLDQSFVARLRETVYRVGEAFAVFEFASALQVIEDFFWSDLCDNYLELVKVRSYSAEWTLGKRSALTTLKLALSLQLRLFAPYLPFVTEEVWSWLFAPTTGRERSIHTSAWPTVGELDAVALPVEMDPYGAAVEVLREVRRIKSEAKVSMKTLLQSLEIRGAISDLNALSCVQNDLLAVTGAAGTTFIEGSVKAGRFEVRATIENSTSAA